MAFFVGEQTDLGTTELLKEIAMGHYCGNSASFALFFLGHCFFCTIANYLSHVFLAFVIELSFNTSFYFAIFNCTLVLIG